MLTVRDIGKNYGAESVLQGISFHLPRGVSMSVQGISGGGKTTLLSIIGLLQQPTFGSVQIAGIETAALSAVAQARLRSQYFGYIFQRSRLLGALTALENVLVPAWLQHRCTSKVKQQAEMLLGELGLGQRLTHHPQELSLGQLRRVALARALLLQPPLILADEPTNDLDPELARAVTARLLAAVSAGSSLLMITHDTQAAAKADLVYTLQNGSLLKVA